MNKIILTTLNAKYIHTAFGLRYLFANLDQLQKDARIIEFGIQERAIDIVENLLQQQPQIIGFGIYIWNVQECSEVITILKQVAPDIQIILGGPEVSHPPDFPDIVEIADYVITGPAESSFKKLCNSLLNGIHPSDRVIQGVEQNLNRLKSPYPFYTEEDIRNRIIYVEASRGCPFKCEFCLSALDKSAYAFNLEHFLNDLDQLYRRGARHFKFIDRTFNLKTEQSVSIMEFFLDRLVPDLYLHFEVIPDHMPSRLKAVIEKFPAGTLQFEVGIQSFDPNVQHLISRKQNNLQTVSNLTWLRQNSGVHIHADLIFGLPGDDLNNFAASFNKLIKLEPHEIQVGILKRLRGAPINRHTDAFEMIYSPFPPYNVLRTRNIPFTTMQRMVRFARFWDLIGNSGRFKTILPLILEPDPFERFMQFSDALYRRTGATHKISQKRLFQLCFEILVYEFSLDQDMVIETILADYAQTGEKGRLVLNTEDQVTGMSNRGAANKRQLKFVQPRG